MITSNASVLYDGFGNGEVLIVSPSFVSFNKPFKFNGSLILPPLVKKKKLK